MKKLLLLLFVILFTNSALFAQCSINPYIQDNYELDAKILALRDILEDPSDPDYDNPFLPNERVIPYLEKLSAIYENPNNDPEIDLLFDYFNFHVNQEISIPVQFKEIAIKTSNSISWIEEFGTTDVSGVPELDNLMSMYQFQVDWYWQSDSCSCAYFFLETNYDVLNLQALVDDFESINDIEYAEVSPADATARLNYSGQPYGIEFYQFGEPAGEYSTSACDINVFGDTFYFSVYGGDCFSGCQIGETIAGVTVTDDCQVLSKPKYTKNKFTIYPNPTKNHINITSNNIQDQIIISIFDITGKQVLKSNLIESTLDVSMLNSGVYIVKIDQNNKVETKKLVIK